MKLKELIKSDSTNAFISGGLAGAVSRTVVSPFERIKILLQLQTANNINASYNKGIWASIVYIYQNEGWKGWFRGNGINCVRIFPNYAIQFLVYEDTMIKLDSFFDGYTNTKRLLSGGLCGFASVIATYPIDLIRTRLSIQTSDLENLKASKAKDIKHPPGFWKLFKDVYYNEGKIIGLYKGVIPTCFGVVPYAGLNFTFYNILKEIALPDEKSNLNNGNGNVTFKDNIIKLGLGAISGGVAQTIIYPFDLLRRRFQVINMGKNELGFNYTSIWNALVTIGKKEGFKGYYNGLTVNLFKVVPSTAVSWVVYEMSTQFIKNW
ncbi:hypothetical protein Kpol_541p38 [Vanderwaltozyma polyspora DSM 70294]|uniref:Mitochondrial thiamine pyrophosphate carrier 1 n=1 Tax=Vanderwaltozyma polyspora (strain ATCC 22028 / DSM 70294 / BCRC 21397 / CBS 2163 / NBRC 10782 / NRRL Y-8283 / UCD 57-17) TaxID=436907 RepID=A7TIY4_VANPO|nr:uncharacterized protein Kpol_541p38 [Vanderwaltozyma polyspora DSM 70294]EDO17796.1 hypothetical protein Kpol_541p38 [Vanderwaltozyma polyspora DSM 70294]